VYAGLGLGLMSIWVTVGNKIKISKHCVECVCTFAAVDIDLDVGRVNSHCSAGPLLGRAVGQLACDRGQKGRE